jgi:hypothetical protein
MPYQVEITDTFGGESNYSWVDRYEIAAPNWRNDSFRRCYRSYRTTLIRRAKAAAGWTGLRCSVEDYGDSYTLRPIGRNAPCWVMFVSWSDEPAADDGEG